MLPATPRRRKHSRPVPPRPRFLDIAWHDDHPRFQVLDALLHPDHPARWIAQAVAELDLPPLRRSYHGRGSWAYPPAPLLCYTLYVLLEGKTSPAAWARDAWARSGRAWTGVPAALTGSASARDRLVQHRAAAIGDAERDEEAGNARGSGRKGSCGLHEAPNIPPYWKQGRDRTTGPSRVGVRRRTCRRS